MIYRIIFTTPASRDLDEIGDYITKAADAVQGERATEEIIATVETLRVRPMRQRERVELGRGLRGLSSGNYLIFYRVYDDTVSIIRILHSARQIAANLFPADI